MKRNTLVNSAKHFAIFGFMLFAIFGLAMPSALADSSVKKLDRPTYDNVARLVSGPLTYKQCVFVDNFGRELPGYKWMSWNGERCQPFTSRGHAGSGQSSSDSPSVDVFEPSEDEDEDVEDEDTSCDDGWHRRHHRRHEWRGIIRDR